MNATEKKYKVYYNDDVNAPVAMFSAESLEECKAWIKETAGALTSVDDEHPCSNEVFDSSDVFCFEVYNRPIVEVIDDEDVFNEPVYQSAPYYYSPYL